MALETLLKSAQKKYNLPEFRRVLSEDDFARISASIIWRLPGPEGGIPKSFSEWPARLKQQFEKKIGDVGKSEDFSPLVLLSPGTRNKPAPVRLLPDVPQIAESQVTLDISENGFVHSMAFDPVLAREYYLTYLAHSLLIEMYKKTPWSLAGYSSEELNHVLDCQNMFVYSCGHTTPDLAYRIQRWQPSLSIFQGDATYGDPAIVYHFLTTHKLIGTTIRSTVGLLLGWCRTNLVHASFYGGDSGHSANIIDYYPNWQYEGFAPVERVISGTTNPAIPEPRRCHFTAGCWGTSGFLRSLLQTINIPVRVLSFEITGALHSRPRIYLGNGGVGYLSHGDDPYDMFAYSTPPFPAGELLFGQESYDEWFGPDVPDNVRIKNFRRHMCDLALQYLPNSLLRMYCNDKLNPSHPDHASGCVFNQVFKDFYTLQELEAADLWGRMEMRIRSFGPDSEGTCFDIPPENKPCH